MRKHVIDIAVSSVEALSDVSVYCKVPLTYVVQETAPESYRVTGLQRS